MQTARNHIRMVMIRSGVCLLYAHWEGFIRCAARGYLEYVAARKLKYRELRPNFLVAGLYGEVSRLAQRPNVEGSLELIGAVLDDERRFGNAHEEAISTRSNLNSKVLGEVLRVVGIDSREYLLKNRLIDIRLVANRNNVAHGEQLEMTSKDYLDLHATTIEMMNRFRNDLENAVATAAYRS